MGQELYYDRCIKCDMPGVDGKNWRVCFQDSNLMVPSVPLDDGANDLRCDRVELFEELAADEVVVDTVHFVGNSRGKPKPSVKRA